ncbi:MAG: BamA/TamA family outer membrane protein [Ignavibacteria bacterium]|nr:BamA/TamA family outer membrane protein [Ignavibacteria bacterium]
MAAWALVAVTATALGQDPSDRIEISSLDFTGNDTFSDGELLDLMATRESSGFFGLFLHSISESFANGRKYLDPLTFSDDLKAIRVHYEDHGFASVRVDTAVVFDAEDNSVAIHILIDEGYRSLVDSVHYAGLLNVAGEVWAGIEDDPLIYPGEPFVKSIIEGEIQRVRRVLANEGYPNNILVRDSSLAARALSSGDYSVTLHFNPGDRYRFGEIDIVQEGAEDEWVDNDIVFKQLDYREGDFYSEERKGESERNLNRLGVFAQATVEAKIPHDSTAADEVPSMVTVRPADKHELLPEVTISDEDKAFNIGTGLVYLQRNFLGGARTFTARLRFRTQTLREFPNYFDVNSEAVSNLDLSFEVLQPYIFTNKIKGSWTFSMIMDKQKLYRQEIVKNSFGFSSRFGVYTNGYLDWTLQRVRLQRNTAIDLDLSDPDILRQYNALLVLEKDVQFNSILSFTLQRDKTNDLFSPSAGFVHSITLEESGLLPLLLKEAQPGVPFTQFYRVVVLGRWFFDLTHDRFSIFAVKLKGGFEEKYGESRSDTSRVIPQTHRFFAGGGGSVRGWSSRGLIANGVPELGGNLALEGTFEVRTNLFRSLRDDLLDHTWVVAFLDFGNVWPVIKEYRLQDVALATGLGFRYDTFFGPFRIDFGIRVYDPAYPDPMKRWITQRKFFQETVSSGVLHFGIGHAF